MLPPGPKHSFAANGVHHPSSSSGGLQKSRNPISIKGKNQDSGVCPYVNSTDLDSIRLANRLVVPDHRQWQHFQSRITGAPRRSQAGPTCFPMGNLLCILGAWFWEQQRFGTDEFVIGITTAAGQAQAGPTYFPRVF